ncbi:MULTISPECIES: hypothetical protein [unclassified Halanaerobium]|uniref:hypothetical protein n=1 Tax=unclassified Halanaerobium TaxID=2641197 RepID=UPI000DF20C08|nr:MULTISPECIES: hypothetical protein [unclassified Halanaerobium]RCW46333.1 hypothetical protein DFR78_11522 [Halanaerobium sp. MA284_MarDTE_T2]RCW82545.1 hypothetical protein DER71_12041 [Halanaerobium sp. DL-01]
MIKRAAIIYIDSNDVIMKISDSLDKSHEEPFSKIEISLNNNKLELTVNTEKDILLEKWTFDNKSKLFKEVFEFDAILNKKYKYIKR